MRSLPARFTTAVLNTKLENMVNSPAIPTNKQSINEQSISDVDIDGCELHNLHVFHYQQHDLVYSLTMSIETC